MGIHAQVVPQPHRPCGWTRQIPSNALGAAGRSGLYSFFAGTLFTGGNAVLGLYSGIGSMTASLVDSLIRPLINRCFSPDDREAGSCSTYFWTKAIVVSVIYSSLSAVVGTWVGIQLHVGIIASIATRLFLSVFPHTGVHAIEDYRQADVYTLIFT